MTMAGTRKPRIPRGAYGMTQRQMLGWKSTKHLNELAFESSSASFIGYAGYVLPIGDPVERLIGSGYVIGWLAARGETTKKRITSMELSIIVEVTK